MEKWGWRLGMLILAGVPSIVGSGILWDIFEKWTPIIVWEVVLLFLLSLLLLKGDRSGSRHGV
ncbi:MAG TPA: hypothetical protein DCE18_14525 [Syntrophobacteraceae bacterium]|nr:hypothetical protein [Syntrophobacteraceae bacterium]HBZ57240.1 hypothetical protein [Syntrophobacteraceae bacterium]